MSRQIIRIPDGQGDYKWALWSTGVDDFVGYFVDDAELIRYHCARAYEAERESVIKIIQALEADEKPYHQFTLTWDEASQRAYECHPEQYEVMHKEDIAYLHVEDVLNTEDLYDLDD